MNCLLLLLSLQSIVVLSSPYQNMARRGDVFNVGYKGSLDPYQTAYKPETPEVNIFKIVMHKIMKCFFIGIHGLSGHKRIQKVII